VTVKISEYRGFPTIGIPTGTNKNGETYYFTFGKGKARAILEHIDEIRAFVDGEQPASKSTEDAPF
jgi:hypothetical protein